MTNISGPDELYNLIGGLDVDGTTLVYLASCAAAWEADLSARDHAVDLAGINAEAANELERRAERAEAALERARAALEEITNSLEADGGAPLSLAVAKAALLSVALLSAAPGGAA